MADALPIGVKQFKGIPVAGKKLAQLRRDVLFFSQEEFAPQIGMTKNNLSRIESAEIAGMNFKSFRMLADHLKLSHEALREKIGPGRRGPTFDALNADADGIIPPAAELQKRSQPPAGKRKRSGKPSTGRRR